MKPNTSFTLTVRDIELIENALYDKFGALAQRIMNGEDLETLQPQATEIRELLGRLHNQKNWYGKMPNDEPYIGG